MVVFVADQIYEIKIKHVGELSEQAREEVLRKLDGMEQSFKDKFEGYAKIVYGKNSPLKVLSVDPIAGTIIDYFRDLPRYS